FVGKPLIALWVKPEYASAAEFLIVLAVGEALPMSQWVTTSMILAMGRHRILACLGLADNLVAVAMAFLLAPDYGVFGVCVAFAVSGTLFRGIAQAFYACQVFKISFGEYMARALLPPVATAAVPAAGLALVTRWQEPSSWPLLILYVAVYGLAYLA